MGADTSPPIKKRRPWLAAFLSLVCPGLGQFYNTQYRRGLTLIVASSAILLLLLGVRVVVPPSDLVVIGDVVLLFLALIATIIFSVVDAIIGARRIGEAPLGRWNRSLVYIGLWIATGGSAEVLQQVMKESGYWAQYNIPAGSMIPTLPVGDHVFAWKNYYAGHEPVRGEIAIFKLPRDNKTDYIKRVVGLPGDRIQIKNGILHINEQPVRRDRIADDAATSAQEYIETLPNGSAYSIVETQGDGGNLDNTPVYTVPADHYFVLGDNRDNSLDSRIEPSRFGVGYVPRANLRDRPTIVFWSGDLSRIGTAVQPR